MKEGRGRVEDSDTDLSEERVCSMFLRECVKSKLSRNHVQEKDK